MSKLWLKHQKFLKGNAGFSLVELIIVIAIMAALIAILAPQYLKYVEKSRIAADQTSLNEIATSLKVAATDPSVTFSSSADETVTLTRDGTDHSKFVITSTNATILTLIENAVGVDTSTDTIHLKSATAQNQATIIFTLDSYSSPTYAVTCAPDYTTWTA